jgi:hypothetical protein
MFDIGDSVICVDDKMQPHTVEELTKCCPNWVVEGNRYTIRGFADNNGIVTGVWLEEIHNPIFYFKLINGFQESAFALWRFRKALPSEMMEVSEEVEIYKEELEYNEAA